MSFRAICGVDFSGAKQAGRNTWVAVLEPEPRHPLSFLLASLHRLESLCGTAERAPALAHLTSLVAQSQATLWAFDFPFGLPVEVMPPKARWRDQLDFLTCWGEDDYGMGLECVRRAEELVGRKHIRRLTDLETQAPFDPYHYRIIYQTFYGMRDILAPLSRHRGTAILPFQYRRLANAERVLVEACTSSTLRLLGLPSQNYKQPEGGPLTRKRLRTRRVILEGLSRHVRIGDTHRRVMMRNGGGDALDALIAALGAARSWRLTDHAAVARHPRYPREGRLFV